MNIQELKLKSSEQLITQAEELGIENALKQLKSKLYELELQKQNEEKQMLEESKNRKGRRKKD